MKEVVIQSLLSLITVKELILRMVIGYNHIEKIIQNGNYVYLN